MVRLFIQEGESQHLLSRTPPGALPTQPGLIASPWTGTLLAIGWTGLLAIGGRSRPGTFIKSAAIFSIFDFSLEAAGLYGRRELNRGVFKMEKIEPKPGKLWERTKRWTVEDTTLYGGALGIITVLNRRAVPGAYGFFRYFGAAMVGSGLGYAVGKDLLSSRFPELVAEVDMMTEVIRSRCYERLKQNTQAQASLSRIGKFALEYYMSPHTQALRSVVGNISGIATGGLNGDPSNSPELARERARIENITFPIEFEKGELDGPDIEKGIRAYSDSIQWRDEISIKRRLERIENLGGNLKAEFHLAWQFLQKKEDEFYSHLEDDHEKDVLRHELRLLECACFEIHTKCSILDYHYTDAQKQLQQMRQAGIEFRTMIPPQQVAEIALQIRDHPHWITKRLRDICSTTEELLGLLEEVIFRLQSRKSDIGPDMQGLLSVRKRHAEEQRIRLEASKRLLKWYEEQLRKVGEQGKK